MIMLEDVKVRLASFGYTVTTDDTWMLNFIILKVQEYIKSDCNINTIPEGLNNIAVDMAVGEVLMNKKSIGQLPGFDLSAAIKQIQEGDTSISFDTSHSPEQKLDSLINYLMNYGKGALTAYRCIKW